MTENPNFPAEATRKNIWKGPTFCVLLISTLFIFEVRVNLLLFLYMPLLSGQFFEVPRIDLIFPWLDRYLDWEKWWNPENFRPYEVPELHAADWSWDRYMEVSKGRRLVTVVRGLMKNTTAAKRFCTKEWIDAHQNFVISEVTPKDEYRYDYNYSLVNFSQYIQGIQKGQWRYSNGLDEMLRQYPSIGHDMGLELLQWGCRGLALFVNGDGKGLHWHNANHFNIVVEYHGKKTWEFLDPKYSIFAAPKLSWDPHANGFTCQSPKSIFEKLPTFKVTMDVGDVVLNPVWSWHRVDNEADKETGLVAMASCRSPEWIKALRTPALELHRSFGQVNWVNSMFPSWVRWVPLFRVLQDGFGIALKWYPNFGEEGYENDCFSSKRQTCDRHFEIMGFVASPGYADLTSTKP